MQVKNSSQNGKRPRLWPQVLIVVITLTAVAAAILLSNQTYREMEKVATEQFNQQQLILARSAATGIEDHLEEINEELPVLAEIPAVQAMTPECLAYMRLVYGEESRKTSLRRIDKHGILRFIYPDEGWQNELVGRDYSEETYFIEAREIGERAVSGLIINKVGEMRIRAAYPVFIEDEKGGREFNGVIVASFDIEELGRLYVSPILSGKTGYAWLLNEEGIFLAHNEEGFTGRSAFEVHSEHNPDISYAAIEHIQRQMMAGEEGVGRYVSGWHREWNGEIEKLVAYTPVHIDDHVWSVAVCAPVSEVEEIVQTTRRSKQYALTFVILSLMTGGLYLFLTSLRWSRSLEQEVAKQTKALQEAEEQFRTIFENVAIGLYRTTPDGRILLANPALARMLGYASFEELVQRNLEEDGFESGYPRSVFKQRIESEGEIVGLESAWTRRDGVTLFVRESARAIRDDGGNILYYEGTTEDITERVRAEEGQRKALAEALQATHALRGSEERYRAIVEYQTDMLCRFLPDGTLTFVNQAYCRYHGQQREEMVGHSFMPHVLPEERERVAQHLASFSREKPVATIEHRAVTAGGKVRWQQWINRPIFDEQGNVTEFQAVGRDVTERKKMEGAIKESEERYRGLSKAAFEAIFISEKGVCLEQNSTAEKMFGYTLSKAIGRKGTEWIAPKDREMVMNNMLSGYEEPYEATALRKDGSTFPAEIQGKMMHYKGRTVRVTALSDITARKRAEEALRESEGKYRLLAENTLDAIWRMDLNLEFTYVNPAIFDILGFTPEEWVGTRLPEHCSPEEIQKIANIITHELENLETRTGVVFETSFYNKQGEEIACEINSTILFDETGKPIGLQGTTRDITERVRSKEERERVEQQLHRQERMAAVGQLAGGIAHDFNNMLTVVSLYAHQILRQEQPPARTVSAAETIIKESQRAAKLVGQILDFSRRSPLEISSMDLKPFIKEAVRVLERTLPESIHLEFNAGPEEYVVNGDPTRTQQALMNLVVNARDAMPEGGELRIKLERVQALPPSILTAPPPVSPPQAGGMKGGEWICLSVSDTGTGIPPHVLEHIFEPFFTTKEPGQGTGLGLAQVHGIVAQHGGHIGVETEPGQGTTFRVYLPAIRGKEEVAEEEESAILQGQGETILLVEDNENLRKGGRDLLELLGYRVLTGANGREALEICQAVKGTRPEPGRRIDLVITDIVMPKMGGKQLMQELGRTSPALKVLALTGYAMEQSQEELKEAGFLDVIYKPFEVDKLARVIHRALSRSEP